MHLWQLFIVLLSPLLFILRILYNWGYIPYRLCFYIYNKIPWPRQLIKNGFNWTYNSRAIEPMMMELRQKQLRDYILNCKQEAEKADSKWWVSSESWESTLSLTPPPSPHFLILPNQLGTKLSTCESFRAILIQILTYTVQSYLNLPELILSLACRFPSCLFSV